MACLATLPWTWRAEAAVLAQRNATIGQIVNPGRRGAAASAPPGRNAAEMVGSLDNLLTIIRRTHALETFRSRSLASRLKSGFSRRFSRTSDPAREEAALAALLARSLAVTSTDETVRFSLDWPDRTGCEALVAAAMDSFIHARQQEELDAISAAISILESHAAGLDGQIARARTDAPTVATDEVRLLRERQTPLLQQLEDARLEGQAARASFKQRYVVLRPATTVDKPVKPRPWMALVAALIGGLATALAVAVLADLHQGRLLQRWQLEVEGGPEILGVIGPPPGWRTPLQEAEGSLAPALAVILGAASAAVIWFSGGNPAAATVPPLGALVLWAVWKTPLRQTVFALLFIWLACDLRTDFADLWHTPFHTLNDVFVDNLGTTIGIDSFKFSGLELGLLMLLGLVVYRKATRSPLDRAGQVQTAPILGDFVFLWLAALVGVTANGLAGGAPTEVLIWQARPILTYALLFFLYQGALRGPRDVPILAKLLVLAALLKALLAMWIAFVVSKDIPQAHPLEYATNHHDSITFAVGSTILFANFAERSDRKRFAACACGLPVLFGGMIANNRRLVWVELAMVVTTIYLVSPWTRWKRALTRAIVIGIPVVALYVAAGWSSTSGLFKPVAVLRSIADSKSDRSTLDRDVENWNLLLSMRDRPFLGSGFGREYTEYWVGDDISKMFPMYKAVPHNSVLGLLLFCGALGFIGLWCLLGVGIFLATRAYHRAREPSLRAAALCCMSTILIVVLQAYGDMGIISLQAKVLLPLALVLAGKLAVATGAWPARGSKPRLAAAPAPVVSASATG